MSVDIEDTHRKIVPTAGATVLIKMDTQKNQQSLVHFTTPDGGDIPFGASINDSAMNNTGIVGQAGMAMVSLQEGENTFVLKWKKKKQEQQCTVHYHSTPLEQPSAADDSTILSLSCLSSGDKK